MYMYNLYEVIFHRKFPRITSTIIWQSWEGSGPSLLKWLIQKSFFLRSTDTFWRLSRMWDAVFLSLDLFRPRWRLDCSGKIALLRIIKASTKRRNKNKSGYRIRCTALWYRVDAFGSSVTSCTHFSLFFQCKDDLCWIIFKALLL